MMKRPRSAADGGRGDQNASSASAASSSSSAVVAGDVPAAAGAGPAGGQRRAPNVDASGKRNKSGTRTDDGSGPSVRARGEAYAAAAAASSSSSSSPSLSKADPALADASSVVVQFQAMGSSASSSSAASSSSSSSDGVPIDIPLDVTTDQLNILLAKLVNNSTAEETPYAFYLNDVEITGTLRSAMNEQGLSAETSPKIVYQPLSVFRVLPVTRCTDSLPGHTDSVLHVSFSPNGAILASGGGDTMVRFWDVGTTTPRSTCSGHRHHVLCTAWSPDGALFASADKSGEVRVWNATTGKPACAPLKGHASWVTSLAWEPLHAVKDGAACELLASAAKDGTVRVWNVRTGTTQFTISGHKDSIECVKWGGQGLIYTASRDRTIMVWSVAEDKNSVKLIRTLTGHGHRINSIALNTDYLCRTGAYDPVTNDSAPAPEAAAAAAKTRFATGLATVGGKELLVSCSDDFTLFLWSPTDSNKPVARMTGHQQAVNHLSFSPDGRTIASASFDKKVKLWEGRTGKFIATYLGHVGAVYQVCWSADSRLLASASKDSTVKIWSARVGQDGGTAKPVAMYTLSGHADEVFALDWSPAGDILASGGRDRVIKL